MTPELKNAFLKAAENHKKSNDQRAVLSRDIDSALMDIANNNPKGKENLATIVNHRQFDLGTTIGDTRLEISPQESTFLQMFRAAVASMQETSQQQAALRAADIRLDKIHGIGNGATNAQQMAAQKPDNAQRQMGYFVAKL